MKLKELLEVINPYEPIELSYYTEKTRNLLLRHPVFPGNEYFLKPFYDMKVNFINSFISEYNDLKGYPCLSVVLIP